MRIRSVAYVITSKQQNSKNQINNAQDQLKQRKAKMNIISEWWPKFKASTKKLNHFKSTNHKIKKNRIWVGPSQQ